MRAVRETLLYGWPSMASLAAYCWLQWGGRELHPGDVGAVLHGVLTGALVGFCWASARADQAAERLKARIAELELECWQAHRQALGLPDETARNGRGRR